MQDRELVELHGAAADPRLRDAFGEYLCRRFDLRLHFPVSLDRQLAASRSSAPGVTAVAMKIAAATCGMDRLND